jgi:hypothetical protein
LPARQQKNRNGDIRHPVLLCFCQSFFSALQRNKKNSCCKPGQFIADFMANLEKDMANSGEICEDMPNRNKPTNEGKSRKIRGLQRDASSR